MYLQDTLKNGGPHLAWASLNQTSYHRFLYFNILASVLGRSIKEALVMNALLAFSGVPYSQLRKRETEQTGEKFRSLHPSVLPLGGGDHCPNLLPLPVTCLFAFLGADTMWKGNVCKQWLDDVKNVLDRYRTLSYGKQIENRLPSPDTCWLWLITFAVCLFR